MSSIPDAYKSILCAPGNAETLVHSIREGFRRESQSVALDDILVNGERGLNLRNVKPRVDIWHAEADVNMPIHAGLYLRGVLPNSSTVFLPGERHFFLLKR